MTDLRELEPELSAALRRLEPHTKFADVLAQSTQGQGTRADHRTVGVSRSPWIRGAAIRAWGTDRWIEAATSQLDTGSLYETINLLIANLRRAGSGKDPPGVSNTTRREWVERPAKPMRDVPVEETIALAKDAVTWAREVPKVRDAQVRIEWADEERFYLNTAGARCYSSLPRVVGVVVPIAMENGRVEFDFDSSGGLGGRERIDFINPERVRETSEKAAQLLSAAAPPMGEMEVLLDPGTTGTLAHESFGHGTEADQFLRDRSYLKPLLGSMVGPETLTIVDDGAYPGGWGSIFCDDDGHPGQRTVLIDRGRFVSGLHDRETAGALHASPTGNARRADFLSRVFVRMTNTFVEPGDWTLEELVKETRHGVLLERATSGIEDPQGGQMQLKVKYGHRIENGERAELVSSMALSGKVLDVLKSVRGVSRKSDFEITVGTCGKGHTDMLPVGSGGTYLLATAIVGPA
jgi:TldD protein